MDDASEPPPDEEITRQAEPDGLAGRETRKAASGSSGLQDTTNVATADAVQGEVRDFIRAHEQRRTQFPRAILVGCLAGGAGTLFRYCLDVVEKLRTSLVDTLHHHGDWTIVIPMAVAGILAGVAVGLVRKFAPEASGSGIPHVKAVILHLREMRWRRLIPVKFIGGVAGIGAGLALGREGPTIQIGGAIGQLVSEMLKVNPRERQTLVAAGAGAGLAAAFNAPLAGMVFVLEEVQRDFTPTVFAAALVASVMADVVTRSLAGQQPVFSIKDVSTPPLTLLPAFLVLGFAAGLLGVVYNRGLLMSLDLFQRGRRIPGWVKGVLVGILAGAVVWLLPNAAGGGYPILAETFSGQLGIGAILGFFVLRFALTMLSYGCGAPGGIFAPLLVLGALLGLATGEGVHWLFPRMDFYPAAFAVVGMGAYFSAIVRAPLTGIVLMLEMTGHYGQMLPLILACALAYGVADWLGDRPVYEALLERDLLRSQHVPELTETLLVDVSVESGAPFVGKEVKDLGLPGGCILITVHRGIHDQVPTAVTVIEAGDRLTAVISPAAVEAAALLRKGVTRSMEHDY